MNTVIFINFICIWIAIAALQLRASLARKHLNGLLKAIEGTLDRLIIHAERLDILSNRLDILSNRLDIQSKRLDTHSDSLYSSVGTHCTSDGFHNEYRFLSNFFPVMIVVDDTKYPSVENAYQAAKTNDQKEKLSFTTMTPGQAKRAGGKVALRPDWYDIRIDIMEQLVRKKFTENRELADALIATDTLELVEINTWGDFFWGVCEGKGTNWLGKILMKVRLELQLAKATQK
jgi:hypothetical protein